ncbi:DNA mismatch repair protein MSH2 [Nematocida major]|uniref:DNA mismatch repair protein MSH2 n=1 Tax=Nematocida major TaxID=1912982 RepID=UPI002007C115|nr:DNA mismatch repair protein MSH2 [Nematocida major]KAH9386881.1 DNA mismatch repair protein MSH2 [Nematocida major]
MIKLLLEGEQYKAAGESAKMLREALNERGDGDLTISQEAFGKIIPVLINEYRETVHEYTIINGKEVKIREGSPGNWADYPEYLINSAEITRMGAVVLGPGNVLCVELASASTVEKEIKVYRFVDNELYTNLAQVIHEQNIREIVYVDSALEKVFIALGVTHYSLPKRKMGSVNLLEKHLNVNAHGYKIDEASLSNVLRMDKKAADSLLAGDIRIEDEINCCTLQGKRLLQLFMRAPLIEKDEILKRQSIVAEILESGFGLRDAIKSTPDTFTVCKRQGGVLTVQQIMKLYKFIGCVNRIYGKLQPLQSLKHESAVMKDSLDYAKELTEDILEHIDVEAQEIKETCTEPLRKLVLQKKQIEHEIHIEYTQEVSEKNLHKCKPKLENSSMYGYCIKMPRTEENKLTTQTKLAVQKSGVFFTTDRLKASNHRLARVLDQIKAEHAVVLKTLTDSFAIYKGWIEVMNHTVALLDVFSSLAEYAENNNLVRPTFSADSNYDVRKMYHPLLPSLCRRRAMQSNTIQEPIKNDLKLGSARLCIITGPNMGGKTTFLKAVGLVSLLAQMGSYVPAEYACIPIFKQLFIRIGASDNPDKGISTFMAEMMDVSTILNQATEDSLVIIDELGRGTSDEDGYSIAAATVEYLATVNAMTLFATHFHELAQIAHVEKRRVGCVVTDEKVEMTYKIEDGAADTSHGINTARRMGFPEEVLERAEEELKENKRKCADDASACTKSVRRK